MKKNDFVEVIFFEKHQLQGVISAVDEVNVTITMIDVGGEWTATFARTWVDESHKGGWQLTIP